MPLLGPARRVHLVRHGLPLMDPDRPASDWELDPAAEHTVRQLRASGRIPQDARWFTSPEPKARRTAELLTDRPVEIVDALREQVRLHVGWIPDFGAVLASAYDEPDRAAYEGWEPLETTRRRATTAVRELMRRHPTGDKTVTPDDGLAKQKVSPDSNVTDKQAVFAANVWVSAFATAEVDKLVKLSTVPFYAGGKIAANTTAELKDMYSGLVVESGSMRDWKLLAPGEYAGGGTQLPEGNVVVQVRTTKESFAVVLTRTKSGDYRASQLAR